MLKFYRTAIFQSWSVTLRALFEAWSWPPWTFLTKAHEQTLRALSSGLLKEEPPGPEESGDITPYYTPSKPRSVNSIWFAQVVPPICGVP